VPAGCGRRRAGIAAAVCGRDNGGACNNASQRGADQQCSHRFCHVESPSSVLVFGRAKKSWLAILHATKPASGFDAHP